MIQMTTILLLPIGLAMDAIAVSVRLEQRMKSSPCEEKSGCQLILEFFNRNEVWVGCSERPLSTS